LGTQFRLQTNVRQFKLDKVYTLMSQPSYIESRQAAHSTLRFLT